MFISHLPFALPLSYNRSNKLQIKGFVSPDVRYPVDARWQLSSEGSFQKGDGFTSELAEVSLSSTEVTLPVGDGAKQQFFLIFPSNSLVGGVTYTLKLLAQFDNPNAAEGEGQGFAEISILINSPPIAGTLSIDNGEGDNKGGALQTLFTMTAYDFIDDPSDLPLTYSYLYTIGMRSWGGGEILIAANSLSSQVSDIILPNGGGNASVVELFTRVYDLYGSSSEANALAFVTTPKLTTAELANLTNSMTDAALEKGDTSGVFQVLSSSASILNSLNCTLAPNCMMLNRKECSEGDRPHTCGKCIEGFASNDKTRTQMCQAMVAHCDNDIKDGDETDTDCGGGCNQCAVNLDCEVDGDCSTNFCSDNACSLPLKECPGDCNGNGECFAYDGNLKLMDRALCKEGGLCTVACTCEEGFFGKACDKDEEAQREIVEQRKKMLSTLTTVTTMQDVSSDAMSQQSSGIQALVSSPDELDDDAKDAATGVMSSVSEGLLESGGVDKNTASSMGNSISSMMTPKLNSTNSTSGSGQNSSFAGMSGVLDNLMTAQILGQFVGEAPAGIVTGNVKTAISKVGVANTGGAEFATPVSAEAAMSGQKPPKISLPGGESMGALFPEGCSVGVSMAEMGSAASDRGEGNTTLDSSVSRFGMGCFRSDGGATRRSMRERKLWRRMEDSSKVTIVVQNSGTVDYYMGGAGNISSAEDGGESGGNSTSAVVNNTNILQLVCEWDYIGNVTGSCSGSNSTISRPCSGVYREYDVPCGGFKVAQPGCATSGGLGPWNEDSCVVVSFTATNTTCKCDVLGDMFDEEGPGESRRRAQEALTSKRRERRRRLQFGDDPRTLTEEDAGGTSNIDMGGLVGSAFASYAATFAVAATLDLATVLKNIFVFIVMGSALFISVVCCAYGNWKDGKEGKKARAEAEEKARETENMSSDERRSQLVEDSTPTFAAMVSDKLAFAKKQLGAKHEYAEVFFEFSSTKSRPQRVTLLLTAFLTLLFIQALLYEFMYPDSVPGCDSWTTKVECETPRNLWNTTADRCLWTSEAQECSFIEPEMSATGTLVMSILAIIISSPICLFVSIVFNSSIFPPVSYHWGSTGDAEMTNPDDDDVEAEEEERPSERIRKRDIIKDHLLEITNIQSQLDKLDALKYARNLRRRAKAKTKDVLSNVDAKLESLRVTETQLLMVKRGQSPDGRFFEERDEKELESVQDTITKIEAEFYNNSLFKKIFGSDSKTRLYKKIKADLKLADAIEGEVRSYNKLCLSCSIITYTSLCIQFAFVTV